MTEPEEFSLLNLDKNSLITIEPKSYDDSLVTTYRFHLSQTIKVEKRQVTSLPALFGDLGGLYEFLATIVMTVIGSYQTKAFTLDQVRSFFRLAKFQKRNPSLSVLELPARPKLF